MPESGPTCAHTHCDATGRIRINRVGGQQDTAWYCEEHAGETAGTTMGRRDVEEAADG